MCRFEGEGGFEGGFEGGYEGRLDGWFEGRFEGCGALPHQDGPSFGCPYGRPARVVPVCAGRPPHDNKLAAVHIVDALGGIPGDVQWTLRMLCKRGHKRERESKYRGG